MCMTFAVSIGGAVICAADTRYNNHAAGKHRDLGGKLVRTPNGWAAASGNGFVAIVGLRRLAEGVPPLDAVRAAHDSIEAEHGDVLDSTVFTIAFDNGRIARLVTDGTVEHYEPGAYVASWPPELAQDRVQAITAAFTRAIDSAASLCDYARAVAGTFASASRLASTMSPVLELGVTFGDRAGWLRHDANALARLDDGQLPSLLSEPPHVVEALRAAMDWVFGLLQEA